MIFLLKIFKKKREIFEFFLKITLDFNQKKVVYCIMRENAFLDIPQM